MRFRRLLPFALLIVAASPLRVLATILPGEVLSRYEMGETAHGSGWQSLIGGVAQSSVSTGGVFVGGPFASANAKLNASGTGDAMTFDFTFSDSRRNTPLGTLAGNAGVARFSVSEAVAFDISGLYSVNDADSPSHVSFFASLMDLGSESYLFRNHQESPSTVDESFTLGELGSVTSSLFGATSGILQAGHSYEFFFNAFNDSYDTAAGSGAIQLKIGGGAQAAGVPDTGTTAALLGAALCILAAFRRRQLAA